jgi:hypothetical protein
MAPTKEKSWSLGQILTQHVLGVLLKMGGESVLLIKMDATDL